jgi:nicotinate-nucleotide pyrophosphorylase (carboxylating)
MRANIVAKSNGVLSGVRYAKEIAPIFEFECEFLKNDRDTFEKGDIIAILDGKVSSLLTAERSFLNLLQHSSGIATNTRRYKDRLDGFSTKLLDTRKTRPSLRNFEKYSVKNGGGMNHRMGLDTCLMIKDTHLKTIESLKEFIPYARDNITFTSKIEVECDNFELAIEAFLAGADIIMCDNLSPNAVREIVEYRNKNYPNVMLEASGNITLDNLVDYASTGVDAISSGSLIHQATWLDMSMKFI